MGELGAESHDISEDRVSLEGQPMYGEGNKVSFALRDWQAGQGYYRRSEGDMDNVYISKTPDGGKVVGARVGGDLEIWRNANIEDVLGRSVQVEQVGRKAKTLAEENKVVLTVKKLGQPGFNVGIPTDLATGDGIFYLTPNALLAAVAHK